MTDTHPTSNRSCEHNTLVHFSGDTWRCAGPKCQRLFAFPHSSPVETKDDSWWCVHCGMVNCPLLKACWNCKASSACSQEEPLAPDVNDMFRAGVTQAKYRMHFKKALQRIIDEGDYTAPEG